MWRPVLPFRHEQPSFPNMVHVIAVPQTRPEIVGAGEIRSVVSHLFKPIADELAQIEAGLSDPTLSPEARLVGSEIIRTIVVPVLNEIERIHGYKITLDFKSDEARRRHGLLTTDDTPTPLLRTPPSQLGTAIAKAIDKLRHT